MQSSPVPQLYIQVDPFFLKKSRLILVIEEESETVSVLGKDDFLDGNFSLDCGNDLSIWSGGRATQQISCQAWVLRFLPLEDCHELGGALLWDYVVLGGSVPFMALPGVVGGEGLPHFIAGTQ